MNKFAIIGCSATKDPTQSTAEKLYIGDLFKASVQYCKSNEIPFAILSAKYGLLMPDSRVSAYDTNLKYLTFAEKVKLVVRRVCGNVFFCVRDGWTLELLCSHHYSEIIDAAIAITPSMSCQFYVNRPFWGLGIGEQKHWLKNNTKSEVKK